MGSLLSVYELRGRKDKVLLEKAVDLANKMAYAWVGVISTHFLANRCIHSGHRRTMSYLSAGLIFLQTSLMSEQRVPLFCFLDFH